MPVLRAIVGLLSAIRWIWFPAALFAVIALGVHAGADALDDSLLVALDQLDAWADQLLGPLVRWLWLAFGATPARADAVVLRVCELVGLEERTLLAQWIAILLELLSDVLVLLLLFAEPKLKPQPRRRQQPWFPLPPPKVLGRRLLDWGRAKASTATLRSVFAPAVILATSLAGACVVAEALQSELFGAFRHLFSATVAAGIGRLCAVFALGAALLLFAAPAVIRVTQSSRSLLPPQSLAARLAGWRTLLLLAPVSLAALVERTPLLSFFR